MREHNNIITILCVNLCFMELNSYASSLQRCRMAAHNHLDISQLGIV